MPTVDPDEFVRAVQPILITQDLNALLRLLKSRWTAEQILALLHGPHLDAKKVALLAVGLVGPKCCSKELVPHLKDPDPVVREMAEHALWSVWFRSGDNCDANRELSQGAEALHARDFDLALEHFDAAIRLDPAFAEAYNQRAILHYLRESYELSIEDCQRTVQRMPFHFGAWSGKGHCHAHLGEITSAIDCYKRALTIHPHLESIKEALCELKRCAS